MFHCSNPASGTSPCLASHPMRCVHVLMYTSAPGTSPCIVSHPMRCVHVLMYTSAPGTSPCIVSYPMRCALPPSAQQHTTIPEANYRPLYGGHPRNPCLGYAFSVSHPDHPPLRTTLSGGLTPTALRLHPLAGQPPNHT